MSVGDMPNKHKHKQYVLFEFLFWWYVYEFSDKKLMMLIMSGLGRGMVI